MFMSLVQRIRNGETLPWYLDIPLACLTPVQRLGMAWRLRQPAVTLDARVISFGNLTAGGTGKTPLVIERAQQEQDAGHRVAVLIRGYGSGRSRENIVLQTEPKQAYAELGDEAALIARRVPGIIIAQGRDRVESGRRAIQEFGCDTLILDDGFQYIRLARTENILVIDATAPFGNRHVIPRGILREPLSAMRRSTHIVLTRCDQCATLPTLLSTVQQLCPNIPIRLTRHAPRDLWHLDKKTAFPLHILAGKPVTAVSGIGSPESFHMTLESLDIIPARRLVYPDHAPIPLDKLPGDLPVVMTEKDVARFPVMPALPPGHPPVYALRIQIETFTPE